MKKTMKRFAQMVAVMMVAIMALGAFPLTAQANPQTVTIIVDGRTLVQNDDIGHATIIDGRTFVPLRLVAENMGVEVLWQEAGLPAHTITLRQGNFEAFHRVGSLNTYNTPSATPFTQTLATTDVPSFIHDGRTMVGIRLISDTLGAEVEWTSATRTVTITTNTPADNAQVSDAHRNAWRPTNPAFIEMALALEVLAETPLQNGNLEGTLYTVRSHFLDERGQMVSAHRRHREGIASAMLTTPRLHEWRNENNNAIGALGSMTFSDISGTETYAADLVMLLYYNVLGDRFADRSQPFRGSDNITRTEAVDILFLPQSPSEFRSVDEFNPMTTVIRGFGFPQWAERAWLNTQRTLLSQYMTPAQAQQVANGYLTRIETAILINEIIRPNGPVGSLGGRIDFINTQDFRNQLNAAFSDMRVVNFDENATGAMAAVERRTGVRQLDTADAWHALEMHRTGVMPAFADGTFRPHDTVTRGQFITYLVRALEINSRQEAGTGGTFL